MCVQYIFFSFMCVMSTLILLSGLEGSFGNLKGILCLKSVFFLNICEINKRKSITTQYMKQVEMCLVLNTPQTAMHIVGIKKEERLNASDKLEPPC